MDFTRGKVKRRLEIFPILLLALVFWIVTGFVYYFHVGQDERNRAIEETARLEHYRIEMAENLGRAIVDLRLLSKHTALMGAQLALSDSTLSLLGQAFLVWANESANYDQIRLLDLDGQERVRVNWSPAGASLVPAEGLQNKAHRYYFRHALALVAGGIYLSPFDLNVEHGAIERPLKPVLRLAAPVLNARGEKVGVLVLNYLGDSLLRRLQAAIEQAAGDLELVNAQGYWLHAVDPAREWGFMLPHRRSFAASYPAAWARISVESSGQFTLENGLFSFATIDPLAPAHPASAAGQLDGNSGAAHERHWKLVSRISAQAIAADNRKQWRATMNIALPLFLGLAVAATAITHLRERRRRAESALALSERGRRSIVENSLDAILTVDAAGAIVDFNPAACDLFGIAPADGAEARIERLLPEPSQSKFLAGLGRTLKLEPGSRGERLELGMRRLDGRELVAELALSPVEDASRSMVSVFIRDVSERKRVEMSLRENHELLERQVEARTRELSEEVAERKRAEDKLRQAAKVFESTHEAILITNAQRRVVAANAAFSRITGVDEFDIRGQMPWFFDAEAVGMDLLAEIEALGSWQGQLEGRRHDDSAFPAWLSISIVRNPYGRVTNYVAVFSDISEIKRSQARLDYLAHHDALTRLPNRMMFNSLLQNAIVRARRSVECLAVLFVDLDRFKNVNDSLGHEAGDELLKVVGQRMRATLREADTLARMGGDEFTVLLDAPQTREEAGLVAHKLIDAVREPVNLSGTQVYVGASIGISIYPDDGDSVDTLLRSADVAMFSAKQDGRDRYHYSTAASIEAADQRVDLERDLRRALINSEFRLVLQSQFDLARLRPLGAEALLRWQHPDQGELLPERFLGMAEDTGLIQPIGDWVLRKACSILTDWRRRGLMPARLSINLSARQLRDDGFIDGVIEQFRESGLPAGSLELDLPESVLLPGAGVSTQKLDALRSAGLSLAIDDFGGACTALGSLRFTSLDRLKLAPGLIQDLADSRKARRIVAGLLDLATSLELPVLAKGIESEAQCEILRELGCLYGQGFALGRPLEPTLFATSLSTTET